MATINKRSLKGKPEKLNMHSIKPFPANAEALSLAGAIGLDTDADCNARG